ncbi:uncharacterized protein J3R85_014785 [Psidium guajava]|nr:uncharacterized protein J3R85_014785 [Psidium guajava]
MTATNIGSLSYNPHAEMNLKRWVYSQAIMHHLEASIPRNPSFPSAENFGRTNIKEHDLHLRQFVDSIRSL